MAFNVTIRLFRVGKILLTGVESKKKNLVSVINTGEGMRAIRATGRSY